jgi:hypothetical protein
LAVDSPEALTSTRRMLKNSPSRSRALLIAAIAVYAFAVPSMASAASWAVVGTTHVLDSSNFSFIAHDPLNAGASCAQSQFHADVRSGAVLTITTATFNGCTGTAGAVDCAVTMRATRLAWSATAIAENDLRIDGVHLDAHFQNKPGDPTACALPTDVTVTGNLSGGGGHSTWDFFAHQMTFTGASGLTAHVGDAIGSFSATVTATIRDTTQTLTIN